MENYIKKSFKVSESEDHAIDYNPSDKRNYILDDIPNLVGKKFGSMEVIKWESGTPQRPIYLCKCGCGKEIKRTLNDIFVKDKFNCKSCSMKLLKSKTYKYAIPFKSKHEIYE